MAITLNVLTAQPVKATQQFPYWLPAEIAKLMASFYPSTWKVDFEVDVAGAGRNDWLVIYETSPASKVIAHPDFSNQDVTKSTGQMQFTAAGSYVVFARYQKVVAGTGERTAFAPNGPPVDSVPVTIVCA